jgi:hypothetical protein
VVVFDESYTSEDSRVAEGVKVALEWAPDVVLLDFGAPMRNNALSRLIGDNSGSVLFTAPAGNESSSRAVWPAAEDGVLAIAATTARGGLATFCSHGRNVRFAAPGVDLLYLAEARGEELQFLQISGTSAAAAVATAAFSLALAAAGSLRPRALDDAATATGQTVTGHSGIRLIDADELIRRVMRTAESKPEG